MSSPKNRVLLIVAALFLSFVSADRQVFAWGDSNYTNRQNWIDAVTAKGWDYDLIDASQVTGTLGIGSALLYDNGGSLSFDALLSRAADEAYTYDTSIIVSMLSTGDAASVTGTFGSGIRAFGVIMRPTGTPPEGWGYVMGIFETSGTGISMGFSPAYNDFLGTVIDYNPGEVPFYQMTLSNLGSGGADPSGFVFGGMMVAHAPDTVVPEPVSSVLFLLGSGVLVTRRIRVRARK